MTTDLEQAFIAEIQAKPLDPVPRWIYADWLEEQGDPWAELVRLFVDGHDYTDIDLSLDAVLKVYDFTDFLRRWVLTDQREGLYFFPKLKSFEWTPGKREPFGVKFESHVSEFQIFSLLDSARIDFRMTISFGLLTTDCFFTRSPFTPHVPRSVRQPWSFPSIRIPE